MVILLYVHSRNSRTSCLVVLFYKDSHREKILRVSEDDLFIPHPHQLFWLFVKLGSYNRNRKRKYSHISWKAFSILSISKLPDMTITNIFRRANRSLSRRIQLEIKRFTHGCEEKQENMARCLFQVK
jgi:hypothetical protein